VENNLEKHDQYKESFMRNFEGMRPDLFLKELYDSEEIAAQVVEEIRPSRVRTSLFSVIPMNCKGPKCPFADTCPLQKKNIAPVGRPCALEMAMVSDLMQAYMQQLDVDPDNITEVCLVRDLVNQEIQHMRATKYLAKEELIQEFCVGTDTDGNPIFNPTLHVMTELEDRLLKRKKEIRSQMVATRMDKAKAGQGLLDTAQKLSTIMDNINIWDSKQQKIFKKSYMDQDREANSTEVIDAEVVEDIE
jgi:hypothetical protein